VLGTVHWTIEPEKLKFQILVVWAWRERVQKEAASTATRASGRVRRFFFI
jgi:hypothetical protein